MKRAAILSLSAVLVACLAISAQAVAVKPCCKSAATATTTSDGARTGPCGRCPKSAARAGAGAVASNDLDARTQSSIARAMKLLPQLSYKVGDVTTACPVAAKAQSEQSGEPIVYVVNDEQTRCRKSAMDKLAAAINSEMSRLASVVTVVDDQVIACPKAAAKLAAEKSVTPRYMVAGVEFDSVTKARVAAAHLVARFKNLSGSDHPCCASAAGQTASASKGCGRKASFAAGAKTASGAGCGKCPKAQAAAAAKTASGAGCGKCPKARAASSTSSGAPCGKSKATAAAVKTVAATAPTDKPCGKSCDKPCGKSKAAAAKTDGQAAAGKPCCPKSKSARATGAIVASRTTADGTSGDHPAGDPDETEALIRAKRMIRDIVEFVVQDSTGGDRSAS